MEMLTAKARPGRHPSVAGRPTNLDGGARRSRVHRRLDRGKIPWHNNIIVVCEVRAAGKRD